MASFWDFDALPRLLFIRKEWRNMQTVSDYFGSLVFDDRVMRARLPAKVYKSLKKTIDEGVSLDNQVANAVAEAMRSPRGDWRMPSDASGALWLRQLETLR